MPSIFDISKSFFGGLEIEKALTQWHWIIVYAILYAFYCLFYFHPALQKQNVRLIGCGITLSIVLIVKLIFLILRFLISRGFDADSSKEEEVEHPEESRPEHISSDIWGLKQTIINSGSQIDKVVNDLLVSGVDSGGIMDLVDYLQDTNQIGKPVETERPNILIDNNNTFHQTHIKLCNRIVTLPFTIHQIDRILPSSPSFICILISVIFGFSSSYLSMSLTSQFTKYEKVFLSFVLASSTFSIIQPPSIDPYNTSVNDPWNSCTRPFFVTFFCSLWRLVLDFLCTSQSNNSTCHANDTILHSIYDITIEWDILLPYIFVILRYGLFFSLAMLIGYYGHPITTFVAILESCMRYFFGHNGVSGFLHTFVQLLRGSASVATVWGILQIRDPKGNLPYESDIYENTVFGPLAKSTKHHSLLICASICVSTFINLFPIMLNRLLIKKWFSTFFYPLFAAVISFIFPCIYTVAVHRNYEEMRWFCFAWLLLFELVFPYLYSANKYFCFHFLILSPMSFVSIFRYISMLVIAPLYLSLSLQMLNVRNPIDNLVLAFMITHAVHKIHSECHIFAFAAFLSSLTLPNDFGKDDMAVNMFISLLVAARVETVMPAIRIITNSRYSQIFFEELFELDSLPYLCKFIVSKFVNNFLILVDVVVKVPTLFWSFLFGGAFGPAFGVSYFLIPHPIRPNYFFDWPKNLNVYSEIGKEHHSSRVSVARTPTSQLSAVFERNIDEHPVETPVYMSAVRAIAKSLGPVIKSGRLGYVNGGNIYLFKSKNNKAAFFLHVISVEPSCFRFQLRGLEYKDQTLCHAGEVTEITSIADDYEFDICSMNFHAAFAATATDYDFRSYSVNLSMYDVTTTPLSQAFIGIDDDAKFKWFVYSFAFSIKKFITSDWDGQMSMYMNPSRDKLGSLSELLLHSFLSLPREVFDYEFILNARPFFNRVLEYFITTDGEGNLTLSNESFHSTIHFGDQDIEHIDLLFNFFACIVSSVFDTNMKLLVQSAAANFAGSETSIHEWAIEPMSSVPSEIKQRIVRAFLQHGYIYCFLSSSGVLDQGTVEEGSLPNDETLLDVFQQLNDMDDSTVIAPINSPMFIREFVIGDKMLIAITGEKILRFAISSSNWCVFQINQDYARGIWSQESRDILYYGNEDSERMAIQENIFFLNNLIIQACETPIGYPAYSSEIFEAYANPFLKRNLIFV